MLLVFVTLSFFALCLILAATTPRWSAWLGRQLEKRICED